MSDLPPAPAEMPIPRLPKPPFFLVAILLVAVVFSWFPLVLAAVARTTKKSSPRIQIAQDMGVQPKLREQQSSVIFADGRAMRPAIPGTVARGQAQLDDHYYRGFKVVHNAATGKDENAFFHGFPSEVKVDDALMARGQQRFNIYCSACHGYDGSGHGAVNEAALNLMSQGASGTSWTQAANLHDGAVIGREEGNIFNTITNGVRNMPSYGAQIPVADRWAIVAYVRALQLQQGMPKALLTEDQLQQLK